MKIKSIAAIITLFASSANAQVFSTIEHKVYAYDIKEEGRVFLQLSYQQNPNGLTLLRVVSDTDPEYGADATGLQKCFSNIVSTLSDPQSALVTIALSKDRSIAYASGRVKGRNAFGGMVEKFVSCNPANTSAHIF